MLVFKEIRPLKVFLHEKRRAIKSIGFVPTMGALHRGHIRLVEESKSTNDLTVASIFVNPTQFNNAVDFDKYPRVFEQDLEKARQAGVDVLFAPEPNEMYATPSGISFDFGALDKVMEGAFRPGHFSGVATVVAKLFNIVEPDQAYFGQKDWQQFAIISKLVEDLLFGVALHAVPTIREADGLALSSRNLRLTAEQRNVAPIFFEALNTAREMAIKKESVIDIKQFAEKLFSQHQNVSLEYFEIVDRTDLTTVDRLEGNQTLIICVAGWMGDVRLIDNIFI